ncbi:hypothetical protein DFH06DRAFT_1315904 [Mycena polygramma]|nr:hypothetical protein DFH06DRAFT_1315904 [Mycena polygramma]
MEEALRQDVHDFIFSALFYLRFPFLATDTWDSTLACTERELDAKRSLGLLALKSCLESALIRTGERVQDPPNLQLLREIILSDDVLAHILLRAGVCDSFAGRDCEQIGKALLVFLEMVLIDRGFEEFMSWFAHTFDPIVLVAFETCSGCRPEPADTTPTKRTFPFHDSSAGTAKRRRTAAQTAKASPPITTHDTLRQLRLRQMLSTPGEFSSEICLLLDDAAPTAELEGVLAVQPEICIHPAIQGSPFVARPSPPVNVFHAPVSPNAATDARFIPETIIAACPTHDDRNITTPFAISSSNSDLISAAPSYNNTIATSKPPVSPQPFLISPSHQLRTSPPASPTTPSIMNLTHGPTAPKDLEEAAVLFIGETIEMVERGELPLTVIPAPTLAAQGSSVGSRIHAECKRPSTKKVKVKGRKHLPLTGGVRANIPRPRKILVARLCQLPSGLRKAKDIQAYVDRITQ